MKRGLLLTYEIDGFTITNDMKFVDIPENDALKLMYDVIGCDMVDVVYFDEFQAFVDDEGLLKSGNPVIKYTDDITLAGNLLFCKGVDSEGNTLWFDTTTDVSIIQKILDMINHAELRGVTK